MWNLESSDYLLDVMYQMFLHCTKNRDDVHLYKSAMDLLTERPHCKDLVSLLMQNDRNTIIRVSSQKFYGTEKVAEYPIYVITVFPYMGFINGRWFDVPDTKRARQAFANYCVQIFNIYVAPQINSPRKRVVPPPPAEDVAALEETKKDPPMKEKPKTFLQKLKYCYCFMKQ